MITLESLDLATFEPLKGATFRVTAANATGFVDLTLKDAASLGDTYAGLSRQPFSLTFQGKPGARLPQQMYRFENETLGAMEIMITQLTSDSNESTFEAVFT